MCCCRINTRSSLTIEEWGQLMESWLPTQVSYLRRYLSALVLLVIIGSLQLLVFCIVLVRASVRFDIPQSSVLGSAVVFIIYTADLIPWIQSLHARVYLYADDTQLYSFCNPSDSSASFVSSTTRHYWCCGCMDGFEPITTESRQDTETGQARPKALLRCRSNALKFLSVIMTVSWCLSSIAPSCLSPVSSTSIGCALSVNCSRLHYE